jgi:magnesium-protoporphyrin IX monomethyl ester (oxidative) cyclase
MNAPTRQMPKHSADATTAEEGIAIQEEQAKFDSKSATDTAMQNTLLTPRFYTTDFDELDAIDVSPVREDWDRLIAQMEADPNKGHFKKDESWDHVDWEGMDPKLKKEFIDFLISSCTAEFSGCVLYKEMKRRGHNKDITQLFQLMARDEARHAGFINDALREAGVAVNLGFLTPPISRRRSATRATSRSTATSRSIRSTASTRSSSGSASGATTSSATARPSRC